MYVVSVAIADACARSVHASSPTSCDPRRIRPRGGSLGFGSGGRAAPNRDPAAVLAGRLAAVSRGAHAAEQQGGGGGARGAHAKAEHGGGGRVHIGGDAGVVHREMRIRRRLRDIREGGESRCEAGVKSCEVLKHSPGLSEEQRSEPRAPVPVAVQVEWNWNVEVLAALRTQIEQFTSAPAHPPI